MMMNSCVDVIRQKTMTLGGGRHADFRGLHVYMRDGDLTPFSHYLSAHSVTGGESGVGTTGFDSYVARTMKRLEAQQI